MLALNNLAILALAGTTIAAPWKWGEWSGNGNWHQGSAPAAPAGDSTSTSTVWDIQTAVVTIYGDEPTPTPAAAPADVPAAVVTPAPEPSPAAFYSAPAAPPSAPAAPEAPAPVASAASGRGAPAPSTGGYMDIVNKFRSAGGLPTLTEDSKLVANAQKTVNDGNGQMQHELNPGTMGQVLAPGDFSDFESCYVGGWLCEVPSLAGLNGVCATAAQGWDHSDGETGHADILTSTGYTKIGCAVADGILGCDLA